MKRYFFLLTQALAILFASCRGNDMEKPPLTSSTDDTTSVSISCFLESMGTKATVNETLVENVNLYIVNSAGDLVTYGYFDKPSNVDATIYKGNEYRAYVIANAGRAIYALDEEQIEQIVYSVGSFSEMVSQQGGVLMAGRSELSVWNDGEVVPVGLTRTISKIVLKCNFEGLNDDVNIDVTRVCLKNVPKEVKPFILSRAEDGASCMDGGFVDDPSDELLENGMVFYQYENCQGTLQPGNTVESAKVWPDDHINSKICSYVEMEAHYSSPRKKGNILYRFYLGKDMTTNYDVVRNTQHTIVVNFNADGAIDENTWRIDNSGIMDLVTSISLDCNYHKFEKWGETIQLNATVLPATAYDRGIIWSSSDNSVATVDEYGVVRSTGDGNCTITATSRDGTNITAQCAIEVDAGIPVTSITVSPTELVLCKGMVREVVANVLPADATNKGIIWKSTDPSIASVDAEGNVTGGSTLGECCIMAISESNSNIFAQCSVLVRKRDHVAVDGERHITIRVGESYQLKWTVVPEDIYPYFSSANSICVTVDQNGVITGLRPVSTYIYADVFGYREMWDIVVVE